MQLKTNIRGYKPAKPLQKYITEHANLLLGRYIDEVLSIEVVLFTLEEDFNESGFHCQIKVLPAHLQAIVVDKTGENAYELINGCLKCALRLFERNLRNHTTRTCNLT